MNVCVAGPVDLLALLPHLNNVSSDELSLCEGGKQVTLLVRELLKKGLKVSVVTLASSKTIDRVNVFKGDLLKIYVVPRRSFKLQVLDLYGVERKVMASCIRESGSDIVHAHWSYEYALAAIYSEIPHIVSVRDWPLSMILKSGSMLELFVNVHRSIVSFYVMYKGRWFLANSPLIGERSKAFIGKKLIGIVPNFMEYEDPESVGLGQRELQGKPTFICVTNGFNSLKNTKTLIRAFNIVRVSIPNAELVMIGKEHGIQEQAHKWAMKCGLDIGIRFKGLVPSQAVGDVIRSADVLVHPSLEESFGNVLIEAMSKGVPVIAGKDSGAVPWVLGNGECGILIDVKDCDQLAENMIRLISDCDLRVNLGIRGHERVKRYFQADLAVKNFLERYEYVLENK